MWKQRLSILYLRCTQARDGDIWIDTENSLSILYLRCLPWQHEVLAAKCKKHLLSILYLRCMLSSARNVLKPEYALSILYLRCPQSRSPRICSSSPSPLSILYLRCATLDGAQGVGQAGGNLSILYLRCLRPRRRALRLSKGQLSILYLRCTSPRRQTVARSTGLSILYLRCPGVATASLAVPQSVAFNSLFEMQSGTCPTSATWRTRVFQFSI